MTQACTSKLVIVKQQVFATKDGVGFRFTFCCKAHSPTPWLEVEMTRDGAGRFADDIQRAREVNGDPTTTAEDTWKRA